MGKIIVRVAVAAGREALRKRVAAILAREGVLVTTAPSLRQLLDTTKAWASDVIIAESDGAQDRDTARSIRALPNRPDLVFLTNGGGAATEAHLITAGASAVLSPSLSDRELESAIWDLINKRRERPASASPHGAASHVVPTAVSPPMLELLALSERVARSDSSVLLLGETGSGKEWLARRLHAGSSRATGPFVAVNCAAIPEGLAESELFGHERGAFTGAVRARRGHFEMAHRGTLFLDEVAEFSLAVQARLLRVLQDRSFQPLGSERSIQVDVRIIAATNRSLEEAVERGDFRQDLYYRLAVITLSVPPLRERPQDVPALIDAYGRHFAEQIGRPVPSFSPRASAALESYAWPGNIRELINVIERAVLLSSDATIEVEDLPPALWIQPARVRNGLGVSDEESMAVGPFLPFDQAREKMLATFERQYLVALLTNVGGRVGEAARRSGISPRTLYNKMRMYGLRKEDFRSKGDLRR